MKTYFLHGLGQTAQAWNAITKPLPEVDAACIDLFTYESSYIDMFANMEKLLHNIRLIWAFTMALLQVSLKNNGNHPGVLVFDEPDQQSIIIEDMKSFFDSILKLNNTCQVIVAITLKDSETRNAVSGLPEDSYLQHNIAHKAFTFLRKNPIV